MNANPIMLQRPQFTRLQSSASGRRRGLWKVSTCLKLHFVLVVVCVLVLYFSSPAVALILSGLLVGGPLLALGIVEARRDPLWLNPFSFFLLSLAIHLGPSAV